VYKRGVVFTDIVITGFDCIFITLRAIDPTASVNSGYFKSGAWKVNKQLVILKG
jgi:hypothetical protein